MIVGDVWPAAVRHDDVFTVNENFDVNERKKERKKRRESSWYTHFTFLNVD